MFYTTNFKFHLRFFEGRGNTKILVSLTQIVSVKKPYGKQSELSQVAYFKDNILKIFLLMESPTGSKWRM